MSEPLLTPKSPPPIPEKSSLGAASMVLGLLGLFATTGAVYLLFEGSLGRGFKIAVVAIAFFVALASAIMGLVAIFTRPDSGRGFAVSGTLCGGLAIIVIALAGLSFPLRSLIANARSTPPVIVERPPIVVEPILLSDEAMTAHDFRAAWKSWLLRNAIEPKKLEITGEWHEEATGKILDAYLADWTHAPDRPSREDWNRLYAELTDIRRYGEPFSRLLIAEKAQLPRDLPSLVTPINSLREKETNPFWLLLLELQTAEARRTSNDNSRARGPDEKALDAFEQLVKEKWFAEDEYWLLADLTNFVWFPGFFERNSEDVIEILETHEVPEWFLRYMRGRHFHRLSWRARGSGWASEVTAEGWDGFREYQAKARTELEASWELAPEYPFAAAKMISVAMAGSDDTLAEMRLWFDRAIEAQCDYWPAYDNWLWGMHPRWHGTHDAMLEFGEHCLATERWDTNTPTFYLSAVREVRDDSDDYDLYAEPEIYANLRHLYLGMAENAADDRDARQWRTVLAALALRTENHDEVKAQNDALNGDFDPDILDSWSVNDEVLAFRSAIGAGSETIRSAITSEDEGLFEEALELYRIALDESGHSEAAKTALQRRVAILELETRYQSGEWVDLIPGSPDLWREVEGNLTIEDDGSFAVTSDTNRIIIEHPMIIGRYCELEWEVDTPDDNIAAIGPGVMLSSSRFQSLKWNAFYVSQIDGNRQYKVSRFRYRSDMRVDAEKKDRIEMRLVCNRKKWLAYVDGEKVHRNDIDLNVSFFGEKSRLAIGAFTTSPTEDCVIRYHKLRVRKLPEPEEEEPEEE